MLPSWGGARMSFFGSLWGIAQSILSALWQGAQTEPWAAVQGIALIAAALIAWYQIGALRREQKNWETLKACERYESDQVLTQCLMALREARLANRLTAEPRRYSLEMSTILNYLEGIAIGVEQGFYDKNIVRDHLEIIMRGHVKEFLEPPLKEVMLAENDDYYAELIGILKSWEHKKRTYFRKRWS
jgi:hypothetical protein